MMFGHWMRAVDRRGTDPLFFQMSQPLSVAIQPRACNSAGVSVVMSS
jgi:hypothetical protein